MDFSLQKGKEIVQISPSQFSIFKFFLAFLLALLFLYLLLKLSKGKGVIFKVLFVFVVFFGGEIFFETFMPTIIAVPFVLILILFWFRTCPIWFHNLLLGIGIAGIGAVVGFSLSPLIVVSLLLLFSVYDFISVYKVKITQKIAKSMADSGAVLGIIIPKRPSDFKTQIKEVEIGSEEHNFFVLGSGDIIFPLLLSSSVFPHGAIKSGLIVCFSLIGLLVSFFLFLKLGKKPMPALPSIALFSLIGYLIICY